MSKLSERFNRKAYCRAYNLPPSSIKGSLDALVSSGLVNNNGIGVYVISPKGRSWVELTKGHNMPKKPSRSGGRVRDHLSTHSSKFTINILNRKNFNPMQLTFLHPVEIKPLRFVNMTQYILYFNDATVIVKLKTVEFYIHDLISDDIDQNHLDSINRALFYVKGLFSIGIKGDKFSLHGAHYANFKSVLADFLTKDGVGYRVDLKDGCSYWVDFSPSDRLNHAEGETDKYSYRKRLDFFMQDLDSSESVFSDVDKMKEVLGLIVRLEATKTLRDIPYDGPGVGGVVDLKGVKPNYFG